MFRLTRAVGVANPVGAQPGAGPHAGAATDDAAGAGGGAGAGVGWVEVYKLFIRARTE